MIHHKIFVAGHAGGAANWIEGRLETNIAKATLVLFTGGQDISSHLYNKNPHPSAEAYSHRRDSFEKAVYSEAIELGLPCVGICRGAQLLCALNGGSLVQHSHHPVRHKLLTFDGKELVINSCHHQRAFPYVPGCDHKLIGWAPMGTSAFNQGETPQEDMTGQPEAEIVFYKETACLGIQHHPEWMWPGTDRHDRASLDYVRDLVDALAKEEL